MRREDNFEYDNIGKHFVAVVGMVILSSISTIGISTHLIVKNIFTLNCKTTQLNRTLDKSNLDSNLDHEDLNFTSEVI